MDQIVLNKDVPTLMTPSGSEMIVQNSMTTDDDQLMVSKTGTIGNAWMKVGPGDAVKFDEPMYLMQSSWQSFTFPVIDKA